MSKVLIIDTSILCVWLEIPGMDSCGPDHDRWDKERVDQAIQYELDQKTTFVLPLATIIETGNHISQSSHRFDRAEALGQLMIRSAESTSPWAAFADQSELWSPDKIIALAQAWPSLAAQGTSIGDATIKDVAEYYSKTRTVTVEILTGDEGLKAYEPITPTFPDQLPRRRRKT